MKENNSIILKDTSDIKHFERYLAKEYIIGQKLKPQKLVNVGLDKLFGIKDSSWNWPTAVVPAPDANGNIFAQDGLFQEFIPQYKHHVFDETILKRVVAGLILRKPISLVGPQGCGKSSLPEQVYARLRQPFVRIQCTSSMDSEYLFGSKSLFAENGVSVTGFVDGQVTGPRRNKINLLLDEWTHLNPMVSPDLNSFLEMKSDVRLTADGFNPLSKDHVVKATPFQDVWLTSNTGGRDGVEGFENNSLINPATMDRCLMLDIDYLDFDLEKSIFEHEITSPGGKRWIEPTLKFMNLCRDSYKKGELPSSLSTRSGLDFLGYLALLGDLSYAFTDTILAKFAKDDRLLVLKLFMTCFDIDVSIPKGMLPENVSFDDDENAEQVA